jgi:hypothetical protein
LFGRAVKVASKGEGWGGQREVLRLRHPFGERHGTLQAVAGPRRAGDSRLRRTSSYGLRGRPSTSRGGDRWREGEKRRRRAGSGRGLAHDPPSRSVPARGRVWLRAISAGVHPGSSQEGESLRPRV